MPATMLIDSLQTLRRRVKVFGLVYGAGIVVAGAVALLLAAVLIDWALRLPAPLRLVVNLAALAAFGYALVRWVVRPSMSGQSLHDIAGRLEHAFPHFEDTLRSTVNFTGGGEIPGSEVMKQRTVAEATRRAGELDLNKAVVLRPVWYSATAAAGALALIVSLTVFASHKFPDFLRIAAHHLIGGAEPWPKSVEMDLMGGPPQRVAVGQHLDVKMRLKKGTPKQAVMKFRFDNGPWQNTVMEMEKDANGVDTGVYTAGIDARLDGNREQGKLQIKLEAGDDEQELRPVAVVPRLDIKAVEAMVKPPAYAQLPAAPVNISERPVVTVIGSEIDLNVTFNKALSLEKSVRLEAVEKNRKLPQVAWSFPRDGVAVGHFTADDKAFKPNEPVKFTIRATDVDGFENTGSQEYSVIVHDDMLPTVQIEEPRRSEERTPDATVPLRVVTEDDFGIDVAQLVVTRVTDKPTTQPAGTTQPAVTPAAGKSWVIDLHNKEVNAPGAAWSPAESSTERRRFNLQYAWDLDMLDGAKLKPGDVLEFFVQVKDNFYLGGNSHPFVQSGKLRLTIISHDQWETNIENILAQAKQEIGTIKKNQDVTKEENKSQAEEATARQKFDEGQRATAGRLATQQSTAAAQAKQAAQKLADLEKKMAENKSPEKGTKEVVEQVAKELEQTSEGAMKQATSDLNQAKDTKSDPKSSPSQQKQDAQKAAQAMNDATQSQEQASKELDNAMKKLDPFGGLSPTIEKFQKLYDDQKKMDEKYKKDLKDALGKKAEEMSDKDKKAVDEMKKEQDRLQKETDAALNQMDAKADKMAKTDEASSKAMKAAAQAGKSQGIPQKQQQSSEQMQQNQQANAQNSQKQVELGLENILEKLKEAEKRKLEELQAKLAEMQQLIGELIARQSGHNLDNLWLQDPTGKKISDLTEQDRNNLFEWSKRDPKAPIKADLAVLSPSQEQTQRNCRDIADKAGNLPDATPASKLTAAATKMEQAIVFLRKSQLPEAYTPPQVEALALLNDAKKAVDEAKKKADDQQRDQQEESIKAAYVKLLEAQKKLDEETARIDGGERDADGNYNRADGVRLGNMPGEQGKLSDEAKELGKKLESIGSIVYVWANKDIVTSMDDVKDDLAKPATGKPTQAEQKRIEEQLDAMIRNLAKKNEEKPFASRGGGGGGGGGGGKKPPQMPTDVELRLLKELQVAVNGNTVKLAGEEKKDAHKLLALGTRQGDLRGLLDQLLQKATEGKTKLDKEPDNKDQLPEEASKESVEDQEFLKGLLDDNLQADPVEKTVKLIGDRMGRVRQRVALNSDPGKTTQEIEKRIITDMDVMIKLAQKQQQGSGKGKGQPKPGDKPGQPKPGEGQGSPQQAKAEGKGKGKEHQEGGNSPAEDSSLTEGGEPQTDPSKTLRELKEQWGGLSPRERQAVMEGAGEKSFGKYKKFIDDYYRELAKKASER